ncbi:MAG TPA: diguanylate cyclase, partial [Planctomycetaceae bacterium]|nr:diguanylate cyclase [Planctomycetaceae bacterium]
PGMDGIEAGRRIKKNSSAKTIPTVVMVTAYGREEIMRQAENAGLDGFLIKPVNQSVLFNTIMEVLGRGASRESRPFAAEATRADATATIRGARLLVAEDNEINQQVAREILESAGFVVDIANNGREAIEKAISNSYDAVLMDIQMPEMDGLQATAELRRDARFADLPIIAMTAHAMATDREQSLDAGMNDHVNKPIDPEALFAVLVRWIQPRDSKTAVEAGPPAANATERPEPSPRVVADLPGIDLAAGLRRVAGNEALHRKLLLDFHRDFAASVDSLRTAINESRTADAERQAHTLKGVAGAIGAMDLHRAADELDSALRQDDMERVETLLAVVASELNVVINGLEPLARQARAKRAEADAAPTGPAGDVDRPAIEAAVRELAALIRKNNPDAENALERLRDVLKGTRSKEVDRVALALDSFDFRGASEALSALAEAEKIPLTFGD